jgi:hypothetical protein
MPETAVHEEGEADLAEHEIRADGKNGRAVLLSPSLPFYGGEGWGEEERF